MNKKLLIVIISLVVGLLSWRTIKAPKDDLMQYKIEGKTYNLLIADSTEEYERGLMNYRRLDNADGMIFLFPTTQNRMFWNKNTFMDLDIYWIKDDEIIKKDFLPSVEKKGIAYLQSPGPVNKVIEIVKK